MKILVVVDMQNDFIDGALGTKEAVSIVPRVVEKIRQFDGRVLYTRDTHEENYLETQEGRNLPVFIPEIPTKKITWRLRREEICRFHTASGERKAGNWPRRSKRSGWKKPGKRLLISRPLEAVSLDSY